VHKTTLTLDDRMWRAAKLRALDEGTSLQQVLVAALARYLKTRKGDRGT
jgi:hypothetical protein